MINLYGVFATVPPGGRDTWRWVCTRYPDKAAKLAVESGGTLRVLRDTDDSQTWDAPTFWTCSDPVDLGCMLTAIGPC